MGSLCGGSTTGVKTFLAVETKVQASLVAVLWTMCFMVALSTAGYIYKTRKSCSRPTFVIVQLILVHLWLISFGIFYYMYDQRELWQNRTNSLTENIFASCGDLFYTLHLYLFSEQYLTASFEMPLALAMVTNFDVDEES